MNKSLTVNYKENESRGENSMNRGSTENCLVKPAILNARRVEFRQTETVLIVDVLVEGTERQHGNCGVEQVVRRDKHATENCLFGIKKY